MSPNECKGGLRSIHCAATQRYSPARRCRAKASRRSEVQGADAAAGWRCQIVSGVREGVGCTIHGSRAGVDALYPGFAERHLGFAISAALRRKAGVRAGAVFASEWCTIHVSRAWEGEADNHRLRCRNATCRGRGWMRSDNRGVSGLASGARSTGVERVLRLFTRGSQSLTPGSQRRPRCGERQDGARLRRLRASDARSTGVEQLLRCTFHGFGPRDAGFVRGNMAAFSRDAQRISEKVPLRSQSRSQWHGDVTMMVEVAGRRGLGSRQRSGSPCNRACFPRSVYNEETSLTLVEGTSLTVC